MEKTISVNRLFLGLLLFVLAASRLLSLLGAEMNVWAGMVLGELLFLVPAAVFLRIKGVRAGEWAPSRGLPQAAFWKTVLFTILILPLATFLNAFSMLFAENYLAADNAYLAQGGFWLNLLTIAVIPALIEEFIFRGIFYNGYRENGILPAAIACGLVFGMMHRNLNQFFYAAVLGFFFCLLYEATGSMAASVTSHFVINAWSVVLLAIQQPLLNYLESAAGSAYTEAVSTYTAAELVDAVWAYGIIAFFCTAAALCVLVWIAKGCSRFSYLKENLKSKKRGPIFTPSFALAAGICIGYMVTLELFGA